MTNPTNPFSWQMPTATDLVTDLPADFEVFGQAVATSMADLLGGTTGQVLSKASDTNMDFTWVTTDDANAIQNSIVDAKGDIVAASANDTPARLAVGSNGETLVADSSTATGLRWQNDFSVGRNKIINGDFYVNQRNFTTISGAGFGFDRFNTSLSGATVTQSAQTFALGTAPVAGYEGKNFFRLDVTTGNDFCRVTQSIESVRTLAGQTATLSFWAKGTNPATAGNLRIRLNQSFGSGGSPSTAVPTAEQTFVLTANWTRYSFVISVPSISGKTLGTNPDDSLQVEIGQLSSVSNDAWTLDLWGVQLEAGSVATPFQTATGTIQGELAACKRYLPSVSPADAIGYAYGTDLVLYSLPFDVQARVAPTGVTLIGTYQAYALNVGSTVTPAFNLGKVSGASVTAGLTITAGQGSRLQAQSTATILFTGCEL